MNQTMYQIILISLLSIGLIFSSVFLVGFRPQYWLRAASWDAVGWIIIVWLWYIRSLVVIAARWPHTTVPQGWFDLSASVGLLVLIDVLLALRAINFLAFRARDRAQQEAAQVRATSEQPPG